MNIKRNESYWEPCNSLDIGKNNHCVLVPVSLSCV